MIVTGCLGY